jgi:hypothetical protein
LRYNPWFSFAYDAARLGFEAQHVISLRLIRLAGGGASRKAEAQRMVSEKMTAFVEAQVGAATELAKGRRPEAAARRAIRVYSKRVGGNRRRLSRARAKS